MAILAFVLLLISPTLSAPVGISNIFHRPEKCSVENAISMAAIKSLQNNALFLDEKFPPSAWATIKSLPAFEGKKTIDDVFPEKIQKKMKGYCKPLGTGVNPSPQPAPKDRYSEVMEEAMKRIVSGTVWVVSDQVWADGTPWWHIPRWRGLSSGSKAVTKAQLMNRKGEVVRELKL
ncbi:hypothetical protein CC1G_05424 [Coprinopsis cinerea okayama7|uniref:Uncharacterized protein n=1 Tax=Coprinopsis cinerea (strain Okayama-7 / 130 / ATCC MYA-4618 / FGSC 9003) TaxID=240176 RepID=A8NQ23_COPC7|nr:hypothetical protein CC1G_05424 [Coprinopsis cinerea okayama7\|eukprot:XP_001835462.1 hypothetical protein CC1G_05424 [Coprinopsis cinerea okayama7\